MTAWPRGRGESRGSGMFAPVTVVQSTGSTRPEEPFFASGNVAYRQGFIGSARATEYVVASAGQS